MPLQSADGERHRISLLATRFMQKIRAEMLGCASNTVAQIDRPYLERVPNRPRVGLTTLFCVGFDHGQLLAVYVALSMILLSFQIHVKCWSGYCWPTLLLIHLATLILHDAAISCFLSLSFFRSVQV